MSPWPFREYNTDPCLRSHACEERKGGIKGGRRGEEVKGRGRGIKGGEGERGGR